MRNVLYIIILLITNYLGVFSNEINNYVQDKIFTFKIGNEKGEIGYDPNRPLMGGAPAGPTAFTICNKSNFYICDTINNRINVYSSTFGFIKTITSKKVYYVFGSRVIKVDDNQNIIALDGENNLIKINQEGELILLLDNIILPMQVTGLYNFFPFEDKIIYYNNQNNLTFINSSGEKIDQKLVENKLTEVSNRIKQISNNVDLPVESEIISNFLKEKKSSS